MPPVPVAMCACGRGIMPSRDGAVRAACWNCRIAKSPRRGRYTRRAAPRSKTIAAKRLSLREVDEGARLHLDVFDPRPATRGECEVLRSAETCPRCGQAGECPCP